MNSYVLDASVVAKWFLPPKDETLTEESLELLKSYASGRTQIIVPDLFWSEFGNILWKACRIGRISRDAAHAAITSLSGQNIPTHPSRPILSDAFIIADAFGRTVYDSVYVALAVMSKRLLVTADERLANALAAHFPVRWLGSL
jgi:predicted nucleic acid-binding protein